MRRSRLLVTLAVSGTTLVLGLIALAPSPRAAADETRTIDLSPQGWHDLTWSGANGTDPGTALACIAGKYSIAYAWEGPMAGFKRYVEGCAVPGICNMGPLDKYDSLLVLISGAGATCQMPVAPSGATRSVDLSPQGWHDLAWSGANGTGPGTALACIAGKYSIAYAWEGPMAGFKRYVEGCAVPGICNMAALNEYDSLLVLTTAASTTCEMPVGPAATATPSGTATLTAPTASATATPTPTAIVYTGQGDKNTPAFSVGTWSFTVKWTTQSDNPEYAVFGFFVYPEGETGAYVCEANFDGVGSDSTVCRGGPGNFYIKVLAANLSSWRIEVTGPPSVAAVPATFTGQGPKETAAFHVTSSSFTVEWTTQSDNPEYAVFGFFVYPEGETAAYVCEANFDGVGSDSTVCPAGPGDFYVKALAGNLTSWRLDITQ
jgi:hypothetical protein